MQVFEVLRSTITWFSFYIYLLHHRFIFLQIGIVILLILTFFDITYAYVWHPSNLTMYAVDYSTGIIKHVAFVSLSIYSTFQFFTHRNAYLPNSVFEYTIYLCQVIEPQSIYFVKGGYNSGFTGPFYILCFRGALHQVVLLVTDLNKKNLLKR